MDKALQSYPEYVNQSAFRTMLSTEQYKNILEDSGMEIQEFTVHELTTDHADKEKVKDFIRGWLTSFAPLPEHLHEEFLERTLKESEAYAKDTGDGMIHLPYTALMIQAKKK